MAAEASGPADESLQDGMEDDLESRTEGSVGDDQESEVNEVFAEPTQDTEPQPATPLVDLREFMVSERATVS